MRAASQRERLREKGEQKDRQTKQSFCPEEVNGVNEYDFQLGNNCGIFLPLSPYNNM